MNSFFYIYVKLILYLAILCFRWCTRVVGAVLPGSYLYRRDSSQSVQRQAMPHGLVLLFKPTKGPLPVPPYLNNKGVCFKKGFRD